MLVLAPGLQHIATALQVKCNPRNVSHPRQGRPHLDLLLLLLAMPASACRRCHLREQGTSDKLYGAKGLLARCPQE